MLRRGLRTYLMDRLTTMMTFVKVVEAGGFAAASRRLHVSPATVTNQIQALELRLGARLLNRSTRKLSLTDIGKAYYQRCLHILAETDDADSIVQTLHSTPRGTLRLNVSVSIPILLAPVIAEFTSLYPDVKVHVTMTDRIIGLVEEGIDLAISTLPVPDSSLVIRRVGSFRMLVCGAPSYFAGRDMPLEPDELMNYNCLKYSFAPWGTDWGFDFPEGERTVHVTGNMEANSTNALKRAAVLGQGLILLPDFLLSDEIKSGTIVPVLTEFSSKRPINAFYPNRHHLSANVRGFLDLAAKRLRSTEEGNVIEAVSYAAEAIA
jgi:DNA-binding transcriptional LysR family regulator